MARLIKVLEYSHLGGAEILIVRYPDISQEIDDIIHSLRDLGKTKVSREMTKRGRRLYAPKEMNQRFKAEFRRRGYRELRDYYTIEVPGHDAKIEGAYKQIDFVKDKVLVEVQFGKYPFMFYDLAKFQYFYNENKADVGVEIVPCHAMQQQMSSGVSYGEHLVWDIERLKRHFPAVPIKVILLDAVED
ncbi:MAG: BglII/BstYI family type II restriction endonuclease [Armatimonadota bacterium]